MTGASVTDSAGTRLSYEDECKQRIGDWEAELGNLARCNNGTALQTLKTAIEAQLALADLRLRVRDRVVAEDPLARRRELRPGHDVAGVVADPVVFAVSADDRGLEVDEPRR